MQASRGRRGQLPYVGIAGASPASRPLLGILWLCSGLLWHHGEGEGFRPVWAKAGPRPIVRVLMRVNALNRDLF